MASSSALATIERILEGKTTLKTQRISHSNIICKNYKHSFRGFDFDRMMKMKRNEDRIKFKVLTIIIELQAYELSLSKYCRLKILPYSICIFVSLHDLCTLTKICRRIVNSGILDIGHYIFV